MSDWTEACDPVPERRNVERSPEQLARIRKRFKARTLCPLRLTKNSVDTTAVDPDFDEGL